MSADALFKPFQLKSLDLRNRIVMSPMTRQQSPGNVPTEAVAAYYARRAKNQVGLIVTEGTGIDRPVSLNAPNIPHFYGDEALVGWKRVVDAVHAEGGRIAPQLWHVGASKGRDGGPIGRIDSPSGLADVGEDPVAQPMTEAEIADTIVAYAASAGHAKRLGFDAVEFHGAHGYLIDQFFHGGVNRRDDRYGGATVEERTRFATEVLQAVRQAVGPDFPLVLRISQWKQQGSDKHADSPKALEAWLRPLIDAGADILHCSQASFWKPEFEGSDLNLAGWAKKVTGVPTITVGQVGLSSDFASNRAGQTSDPQPLDALLERMDRGEFDLVAVGRALLKDPEWAVKVKAGRNDEHLSFDPAAMAVLH